MITGQISSEEYSSEEFERQYTYQENCLGATWQQEKTDFRLWTPYAKECSVLLYKEGDESIKEILAEVPMEKAEQGTWVATVEGDLEGVYYTYKVKIGEQSIEASDPYAKAVGVNGNRAMVVNMQATNPDGWELDKNPHASETITDAILYEVHIRDFSIDESSGIEQKGKFLGMAENNTVNSYGESTGVDYLRSLGITHVHLLPAFDYGSVDETDWKKTYNWGYDPINYNVPEGSYATDPYDGAVRIKEMKQMVKALHDNGISVVMDVVYNHVYKADTYCFNKLVPGYFSRMNQEGVYSNGSYCGNDTATERSMVHNYIVQSVLYWMEEYHIDGFRFDLVGLMDIDVINDIVTKVHQIRPDVIFYGEGWDMATTLTKKGYKMAVQMNAQLTPEFAYFNDSIRDLIKGKYTDPLELGYVDGAKGMNEVLKANIMGLPYWSPAPSQTVQYTSCHDDLGIFDRLQTAKKEEPIETIASYNKLAAAMILLSEGIPFLHAGEEWLRTKRNEEGEVVSNSYNSSDYVNSIKWDALHEPLHASVQAYYKGLIAFRKEHKALRVMTAEKVRSIFSFIGNLEGEVIAYQIDADAVEEEAVQKIIIVFNPEKNSVLIPLGKGLWKQFVDLDRAGNEVLDLVQESVTVPAISAAVFVQ